MKGLAVTHRQNKDVIILDLAGTIRAGDDITNLREVLRTVAGKGEKKIIVNLAEVTHIDSSGLGELVSGYVSLQKGDGELKLLHLTERVSELMMITKLLTVFDVHEDEEEAVRSFETISDDQHAELPPTVDGMSNKASAGE